MHTQHTMRKKTMSKQTIDLSGSWQFRCEDTYNALPRSHQSLARWMKAAVPGTVHTDLMAAGKIADPFYRTNENDIQWIDRVRWIYRRTFVVSDVVLQEQAIELVADGLDTFAAIRINDSQVGSAFNMFIGHRFDVKSSLHPGINTIEIAFDSPTVRAKAIEQEHGRLRVALESYRAYVRKAQYSFGWDWGPKLTTSGIWRPIRIEAYSGGRLKDPVVRVVSANADAAEIVVAVSVTNEGNAQHELDISITGGDREVKSSAVVAGANAVLKCSVSQPRLWWPNGYGEQHLYTAELALRLGTEVVDTASVRFAIRTVRLVQEPDEEGRSFIIEVNGVPVFCKGADWIPSDSFIPRIKDATYTRLLTMARDASMNMIRVWGGGIYEQEIFYDLCDRLGLMVWQDFMFACGEYPDHPAFLEAVREEAESVVRRLRNHPCIVLWCGNNECEWLFCTENPAKTPDDMRGAPIFRDVLARVVRDQDGTRPYWRSTPFGEGFPNAQDNGNHHQWEVWSAWKDFLHYRENHARFVSEFGFQGPPDPRTLERVTLPEDRSPHSAVVQHHNKQVEGMERLFRFQAAHYPVAADWAGFFHTGQVVQADALKCAVEHWRRRKFRTGGALFWQLNDCWPVMSWSVIDADLRPKASYYAARRFFAPVLVSLAQAGPDIQVWGTNDFLVDVPSRVSLSLRSFNGDVLWRKNMRVVVPPNASVILYTVPGIVMRKVDPATMYLHAVLAYAGGGVTENRHYFLEPKHLKLPHARVAISVRKSGPGVYRARVRSTKFAFGVALTAAVDADIHENWFDLDAGSARDVTISSELPLAQLRRTIAVRALNS